MHFDWLEWSNPVALWWSFLVTVSALNITLLVRAAYRANPLTPQCDLHGGPASAA
jgi:hypothetical protein